MREAVLPLSMVVGILLGLALVIVLPSTMTYSMANEGPTGYSLLHTLLSATPVNVREDLGGLDPNESVVLVSRTTPFGNHTIAELWSYIYSGGVVVASGSGEFLNSLLQGLGVNASVWDVSVYDMVYNTGNRSDVRVNTACGLGAVLYRPQPLNGSLKIIGYTSNYSYADKNMNGYLDLTEETMSYPVIGEYRIGRGSLIIVASKYAFTNKYIEYNTGLLQCLASGRHLYVDQSILSSNPLEYFKLQIKYQASQETRLLATATAGIIGVVAYAVSRRI